MEIEPESTSEKRRFVRVQFREAVQFNLGQNQIAGGCLAYDLSVGGLRVNLENFVPVNAKLLLNVPLGASPEARIVQLKGRVVWISRIRYSDQYLAGLEFNNTENELREKAQISEFIHSQFNPEKSTTEF